MENGLSTAALISPANSQITFNMAASQEIAVDYSGAGADTAGGGVRMNVIPREGGNTFNGVLFMNGTTEGLGSSNFTPAAEGCRAPHAQQDPQNVRLQSRLWRTAAAGQGLVLLLRPARHLLEVDGRRVLRQERQQSQRLDLPARPEPSRCPTIPTSTTAVCA